MRRAISTERRLSRAITRTPSNPRDGVTRVGIVFQRFHFGESIALRISGDGALAGTCDEAASPLHPSDHWVQPDTGQWESNGGGVLRVVQLLPGPSHLADRAGGWLDGPHLDGQGALAHMKGVRAEVPMHPTRRDEKKREILRFLNREKIRAYLRSCRWSHRLAGAICGCQFWRAKTRSVVDRQQARAQADGLQTCRDASSAHPSLLHNPNLGRTPSQDEMGNTVARRGPGR